MGSGGGAPEANDFNNRTYNIGYPSLKSWRAGERVHPKNSNSKTRIWIKPGPVLHR